MTDSDRMSVSHPPTPKPGRREAILAEAARQFNECGYFDTRLEDIAERVGVAKTSISYHFKSKESLLEEVYLSTCDFSDAEFQLAATAATGLERIISVIRAHAYAHANALVGKAPPLALISDIAALAAEDQTKVQRRYKGHIQGLKTFVEEGLQDGSIKILSTDASVFFILSVLQWLPRWLANIPLQTHDEAIEELCQIIRSGVSASPDWTPAPSIAKQNDNQISDMFDRDMRNRLKREAFLRTGTRYLNQKGFRSVSLNEIAAHLGVTRGAFYYYIEDKEALVEKCFDRTCDLIEQAQRTASNSAPTALGELELSLRQLFELHVTELDPLLRLSLLNALPKPQRASILARLKRLSASFAETLARAMVDGSAKPVNIEAVEQLIIGSVFAASRRRLGFSSLDETWRPIEKPLTASAEYFEVFFSGLAAD